MRVLLLVGALVLVVLGCGAPRPLTPEEVCGQGGCDACLGPNCADGGVDAGR